MSASALSECRLTKSIVETLRRALRVAHGEDWCSPTRWIAKDAAPAIRKPERVPLSLCYAMLFIQAGLFFRFESIKRYHSKVLCQSHEFSPSNEATCLLQTTNCHWFTSYTWVSSRPCSLHFGDLCFQPLVFLSLLNSPFVGSNRSSSTPRSWCSAPVPQRNRNDPQRSERVLWGKAQCVVHTSSSSCPWSRVSHVYIIVDTANASYIDTGCDCTMGTWMDHLHLDSFQRLAQSDMTSQDAKLWTPSIAPTEKFLGGTMLKLHQVWDYLWSRPISAEMGVATRQQWQKSHHPGKNIGIQTLKHWNRIQDHPGIHISPCLLPLWALEPQIWTSTGNVAHVGPTWGPRCPTSPRDPRGG